MTSQDHHAMLEKHNDAERERQERETHAVLTAACKPWEFHTGNPPADDSPLAAVFGAGMGYTERLLARLLDVERYEGGDGSEDFDQDATKTLENILTAAKLYDPEDGVWAKLETADAGGPEGATERNKRVQDRIDEMTHIGRHGYYETVFQVVREEVERVHPPTPHPDVAQAVADERERAARIAEDYETGDHGEHRNMVIASRASQEIATAIRDGHPPTPRPGASVEGLRALSEAATPGNLHISGHNTTAAIAVHDGPDAKGHRHLDGRHQHNVLEARETTFEQQRADIEFARAAWNHARAALAQSNPARTPEGAPPRDGGPSR